MQFNHVVFGNKIVLFSICHTGLFQGVIGIIGQVCIYGLHNCLQMPNQFSYPWVDCYAFRDSNYVLKSLSSFSVHLFGAIVRKGNSIGICLLSLLSSLIIVGSH